MRKIIFPNKTNKNFRNGYVRLTAHGSDYQQEAIEGNLNSLVTKLRNTARKIEPDNDAAGMSYLKTALEHCRKDRKRMQGKLRFACILPLPDAIEDNTSINWASTNSNFITALYGRVEKAGLKNIFYGSMSQQAQHYLGSGMVSGGIDTLNAYSVSSNPVTESLANLGNGEESSTKNWDAINNSPRMQSLINPGEGTKQLIGLNSDASVIDFQNEAALQNGTRQLIFNPGYWMNYNGIECRKFTLRWKIIPENHEEAINGLELCARIREFAFPQSVSTVEQMSPCWWELEYSNDIMNSQLLLSNIVITNITIKYGDDNSINGAGTPRCFNIDLSCSETQAPSADYYKANFEPVPIKSA